MPPSRLQSKTPRDLETICLQCLQKDLAKRYPSAVALADDLQRFLRGEPILAKPIGATERAWRWCRRNPAVASLTAAVAAALVAGTIVSTFFAYEADRRANEAEEQKEQVKRKSEEIDLRAAESRRLNSRFCVENGWRFAEGGDLFTAMLWFAEPLVRDPGNREQEAMTRLRLATYWNYTPRPRLLQVFIHDDFITTASFSPNGRQVVTASDDHSAKIWDVETGDLVATLTHGDKVVQAVFSPDGARVATASEDNTVRMWDAQTGREVMAPLSHPAKLSDVAFSPDGQLMLTVTGGKNVRVWNAATGEKTGKWLHHEQSVEAARFSQDSRRVATIESNSRTARLWDAATGEPVGAPMQHESDVACLAFSPDGRLLATGCGRGQVRFWDARTGELRLAPTETQGSDADGIYWLAFSPDSRRLVTFGSDKSAWVWDAVSGHVVTRFEGHRQSMWSAAFSPDGRRVVTASVDQTARVWDPATGQNVAPPLMHQRDVMSAVFSPSGRLVLTASRDKTARLWQLPLDDAEPQAIYHITGIIAASFSPDGRQMVLSGDSTVRLRDSFTEESKDLVHPHTVLFAGFSADGRRLRTVCGDAEKKQGEYREWDAASGKPLGPPVALNHAMTRAAVSADGRRILSVAEKSASLWDAANGNRLIQLGIQTDISSVAFFSADGGRFVTVGEDHAAQIWDSSDGRAVARTPPHRKPIRDAALSADGSRLATACDDHTVRIWNAANGELITNAIHHRAEVNHIAFSPDGRRLVTASEDQTARVWDTATGHPIAAPMSHQGRVGFAGFSHNGRLVVTCAQSDSAAIGRVWEADTGLPISLPLSSHLAALAEFAPDDRRVCTFIRLTNVAAVWHLAPMDLAAPDLLAWAQLWSGQSIDVTGGCVALPPQEQRRILGQLRQKLPVDFTASPADAIAWHRREAKNSASEKNWQAALFHLDKAAALGANAESLWRVRAEAHASVGQWPEALQAFAKLPEEEQDLEVKKGIACLHFAMNKPNEFRQAAAALIKANATAEDYNTIAEVARLCTLTPDAVDDWQPIVKMAERAVTAGNGDQALGSYLTTQGAALYRAGRFSESVETLKTAMTNEPSEWVIQQVGPWDILDWLFLAMAHHRLGHAEEANQWLTKSVKWCESHRDRLAKEDWKRRLEIERLRSEAETLIKGKTPDKGQ